MVSVCLKVFHKLQAPKLTVDELGKAKSFQMFSLARPHMRGFHTSWFCFFIAFTSWFGIQPLIPTISKELGLTKKEIAYSGIASISATILVRMSVGPLCDRFGPRRVMSGLLCIGSIPLALSGLIKTGTGLIIVRFFIGILGGAFIPCQFWTSAMFNKKIVGTANAFVGGWGNLGGGFTFILMPAIFVAVKSIVHDEFLAWKISVVVPAVIVFGMGTLIIWTSDDCPQGHWSNRQQLPEAKYEEVQIKAGSGLKNKLLETNGLDHKSSGDVEVVVTDGPVENGPEKLKSTSEFDLWVFASVAILMCHYGLCFGVEIAVNTVMNLYLLYNFKREGCTEVVIDSAAMFNQTNSSLIDVSYQQQTDSMNIESCSILSPNSASLIASLFGLMNLFARVLGGSFSDVLRKYISGELKGRILAHFICLVAEGCLLILFSQVRQVKYAIVAMVFFSLSVQMSEGTTFALVPYVNPRKVGLVAGLIGGGGNAGAMIWNTIWSEMVDTDPSRWFWTLGICVLCGSLLSIFITRLERRASEK